MGSEAGVASSSTTAPPDYCQRPHDPGHRNNDHCGIVVDGSDTSRHQSRDSWRATYDSYLCVVLSEILYHDYHLRRSRHSDDCNDSRRISFCSFFLVVHDNLPRRGLDPRPRQHYCRCRGR